MRKFDETIVRRKCTRLTCIDERVLANRFSANPPVTIKNLYMHKNVYNVLCLEKFSLKSQRYKIP